MNDVALDPAAAPTAARTKRRARWWTALGLLVALLAAAAVLVALVLHSTALPPINVTIDGEPVLQGLDLAALPPGEKLLLAGALLFALLVVGVIVPVAVAAALLAAFGGVAIAIVLAVGLPLLAVGAVAALLLSPLLLLGWLVWRLVRG